MSGRLALVLGRACDVAGSDKRPGSGDRGSSGFAPGIEGFCRLICWALPVWITVDECPE